MCTAVSFKTKDHYFGRNLDLYFRFNERVTLTPRNFAFKMRFLGEIKSHPAIIGMATQSGGYPLYYEATNENGLSIAGLNFPQNAVYNSPTHGKINLAPFELIPYLLCRFNTVTDAENELSNINLVNESFSPDMPNTPLHFMLSDENRSLVLEPVQDGLKVYENSIGVLTNNPPFETQMLLLQNYIGLSPNMPQNRFSNQIKLNPYSLGMGAMGLPGDLSSPSRFVRAAFTKLNSVCLGDEGDSVEQFFHILKSVQQVRGLTITEDGRQEYTLYSSCCNTKRGIYYYTTYQNSRITAVDMFSENLNASEIISYPINKEFDIKNCCQNKNCGL